MESIKPDLSLKIPEIVRTPKNSTSASDLPPSDRLRKGDEYTQTFHLFPLLPPEIRLSIWAHALPGPRVIEIWYTQLIDWHLYQDPALATQAREDSSPADGNEATHKDATEDSIGEEGTEREELNATNTTNNDGINADVSNVVSLNVATESVETSNEDATIKDAPQNATTNNDAANNGTADNHATNDPARDEESSDETDNDSEDDDSSSPDYASDREWPFVPEFRSACAIPAILHVNLEARELALKHYTLAFATFGYPARIYFNPALDTLYFRKLMTSADPIPRPER